MKYRLQVTTNINHAYEIEADSPEQAELIYTRYTDKQLNALDLDGTANREQYPWDVEDITDENAAPLQIANASSAVASPELSAALAHARALAENPCSGGEPLGFGVYCSDNSGEWIETGFSDEAAAERFATAWKNYSRGEWTARVGLVIANNREQWEGEPITPAPVLGCGNECGFSGEFSGWINADDVAYFPCPNCGTIFEHSDWSEFFDEDKKEDETETPVEVVALSVIGADCVIEWSDKTKTVYISLGEYDEPNDRDTFGVPDKKIFYYANPVEFQELTNTDKWHHDGWRIVSYEWVTQ